MSNVDLTQLINWRREFHRCPEFGWSEFTTTACLIKILRAMGLEVLAGPKMINRDFIYGRTPALVESGLARAKANSVDEALLAEMDGLTGCVAIFDSGK